MKAFDDCDPLKVAVLSRALVDDGLVGFPSKFKIRDATLQALKRRCLDTVVFPKADATIVIPNEGLGANHAGPLLKMPLVKKALKLFLAIRKKAVNVYSFYATSFKYMCYYVVEAGVRHLPSAIRTIATIKIAVAFLVIFSQTILPE
ncbi:MAG: hypothetical protein VXX02_03635, partial [Pseudomonadota bacterium]|nr:hypothetical protein [Pseudomonadota bacterium]